MKRFIEGEDRSQITLFPEHLDDYIAEDNPVRVIDAFVGELDLKGLGVEGMQPEVTGRPAYDSAPAAPAFLWRSNNHVAIPRFLISTTSRVADQLRSGLRIRGRDAIDEPPPG
jgi:transposase